jgi:hypothetical protein
LGAQHGEPIQHLVERLSIEVQMHSQRFGQPLYRQRRQME